MKFSQQHSAADRRQRSVSQESCEVRTC